MDRSFEYRTVPAPRRSQRIPGMRGVPERFAATIEDVLNELADEGWEYVRADTLPCDDGRGLFSRGGDTVAILVFRRPAAQARDDEPAATEVNPALPLRGAGEFGGRGEPPRAEERSERFARALRAVKGPSAGRRRD